MTSDKFRSLALEIPGALESSHQSHPDFRIGGKVFASLGYPDDAHGMVKLTPEEQGALRELVTLGAVVTAQDVPAARAVPLEELLASREVA